MLKHYGLREQPFGATPDPRFLFMSPSHREAFASLLYAMDSGRGFNALVCPPGMGKTTLLFRLLDEVRGRVTTSFIFQTQIKPRELLRLIVNDFGIPVEGNDFVQMNGAFNNFLLAEAKAGKKCLIVLDEAQNLNDQVLESVRLLSDFETPTKKLLHIILAGQPALGERLDRPGLLQLRQRVGILCKIAPLSPFEVSEYINHRLKVAGYAGPGLFTREAMALLVDRSGGVPRNINALCFGAMSIGFALNQTVLDAAIVSEASSDLRITKEDIPFIPSPGPAPTVPRAAELQEELVVENSVSSVDIANHEPSTQPDMSPTSGTAAAAAPALDVVQERPEVGPYPEDQHWDARQAQSSSWQTSTPRNGAGTTHTDTVVGPNHNFKAELKPAKDVRTDSLRAALVGNDAPKPESRVQRLSRRTLMGASFTIAMCVGVGFLAYLSARDVGSQTQNPAPQVTKTPNQVIAASTPARPMTEKREALPVITEQPRRIAANDDFPLETVPKLRLPAQTPEAQLPEADDASAPTSNMIVENQQSREQQLSKLLNPSTPNLPALNIAVEEPSLAEDSTPDSPLRMVAPKYPAAAKQLGIEGLVVLRARVAKNGKVSRVEAISGNPQLVEAAREAVKEWLYAPTKINGKRTEVDRDITLRFTLGGSGNAARK